MTANGPNTIGPETQVVGTIIGSEPLQVEGQVDGKIQVDGTVVVAASGRVKAEIEAREVVVEGYLEGKLTATERVVLRRDSQAHGDITTPRIVVEDGSVFNGNLFMSSSSAS